jgi:membrane-bound lytic murein transglycosylase MltF
MAGHGSVDRRGLGGGNNQPAGFEYDLAKLFAAQYMPDYQIKFYLKMKKHKML